MPSRVPVLTCVISEPRWGQFRIVERSMLLSVDPSPFSMLLLLVLVALIAAVASSPLAAAVPRIVRRIAASRATLTWASYRIACPRGSSVSPVPQALRSGKSLRSPVPTSGPQQDWPIAGACPPFSDWSCSTRPLNSQKFETPWVNTTNFCHGRFSCMV